MSLGEVTPQARIRVLSDIPLRTQGHFVLYWMTAARRPVWNYALDRAVALARELEKPLIVLEALRVGYRWASDRTHRFVLQGMRANERAFLGSGVTYYPYVETSEGTGKGLLHALSVSACAVITDDSPIFFLPSMLASARLDVPVRFDAVDSNGLLPTRATDRSFSRAFDFRRFLQRELGPHLTEQPQAAPLSSVALRPLDAFPHDVKSRWPKATPRLLSAETAALARLPIDHAVSPCGLEGGADAGALTLNRFLDQRLERYREDRNRLDPEVTSGLSPYLHFGHLSPHQVFASLAAEEDWSAERLGTTAHGKREGWWGLNPSTEAYLDQLVTWRELGLNAAVHEPGYDRFESLPDWALTTLAKHADDDRPHSYDLDTFEAAATHDELWNAAQNQLRSEGVIHGYLRMLWGKKILHWSESPRAAYEVMVELNNKYALDGRDPNSSSGILWTLGKFDRAWGPERPIFGKVRYMTSDNTRRKLRVDKYVERWG
jgi:deoxyribodipyrimidine photo-lyase